MRGQVAPFRRAPSLTVRKSTRDMIDDLNFGGFVNVLARRQRFLLMADLMYVDLTDMKGFGPLHLAGGQITLPHAEVRVDNRLFNAALSAGYRWHDSDQLTVDAFAGARWVHTWTRVKATVLNRSLSERSDFGWVEPLVGARAHLRVTPKFSVLAEGDVGGFGAGSRLSWQAMLAFNYGITPRLTASAGYKIWSVDYRHDGHVFDVRLQGPALGLTWRF